MKKINNSIKNRLLLIYPIGLNAESSSSGGYEHYLANKEIYRNLNFKILVIDTLHWPFINYQKDIIKINCIPFLKNTSFSNKSFYSNDIESLNKRSLNLYNLIFNQLKILREFLLRIFVNIILLIYKPKVVHQRSNMRFMVKKSKSYFLITEMNDNFNKIPDSDLLLTVDKINIPVNYLGKSLISPWPVINYNKKLSYKNLDNKLNLLSKNIESINILHLGDFGSNDEILRCISWLQKVFVKFGFLKNINLITYGSSKKNFDVEINNQNYKFKSFPFVNPSKLKVNNINLGLIYYSKEKYTLDRIKTGFPTKLSLYIDLSLPVIINRFHFLKKAELIDIKDSLFSKNLIHTTDLYNSYLNIRNITSVKDYSLKLEKFFKKDN